MAGEGFRKVDEQFFVASQLEPADFAAARDQGVRTIINNRPDGEVWVQLSSAEAEGLAREAGLDYVHIPVVSGQMTREDVDAMRRAVAEREGPILAYCRSGTRSCHLWALGSAADGRPASEIVEGAAGAGYDLASMHFVAESVTEDPDEFAAFCAAFAATVRPGGHLIAAFMENMRRYELGDGSRWPGIPVDVAAVTRAFATLTEDLQVSRIDADPGLPDYGYSGMVLLRARRA